MPGRGIQHVDLAVADVVRSLAFYRELLEPLGLTEYSRVPTHRETESAVSSKSRSATPRRAHGVHALA